MQKNMEIEQVSDILALHQEKKTICDWQASKEYLKKLWFSILKVSLVL